MNRVLFFGSGAFGIPTLNFLRHEHQVLRVITQPDRPSGRGRKLTPTPIKDACTEFGLQAESVDNVNDPSVVSELLELDADLAVVIAFGQKIGNELIEGIRGSCINAHASLLPQYRGAAPIHWAIINGEEKTGVTIFKLVERMDAGPILTSRWTYLNPEENTSELHDRLSGIAVDAMRGAFELYADDPCPAGTPQDDGAATLARKLNKQDGHIDFSRSADEITRLVSGLWTWPGARCLCVNQRHPQGEEVTFARVRPAMGKPADVPPGHLDGRLYVTTGDGLLEILEIKPSGSKCQTWQEYANGRQLTAGDRFESL